jgi:hypothetical protein
MRREDERRRMVTVAAEAAPAGHAARGYPKARIRPQIPFPIPDSRFPALCGWCLSRLKPLLQGRATRDHSNACIQPPIPIPDSRLFADGVCRG